MLPFDKRESGKLYFSVVSPQRRSVLCDDHQLGLSLAKGLQGLLVAQTVFAGFHHQRQARVDRLDGLFLYIKKTMLSIFNLFYTTQSSNFEVHNLKMYETLSTPRNIELASLSGAKLFIGHFHEEVNPTLTLNNYAKSPFLKYITTRVRLPVSWLQPL